MTCSFNVSSISRDDPDNKNKESANSLQNNEKFNRNSKPAKKPNEKTLTDNYNTENKDSNEENRMTIM